MTRHKERSDCGSQGARVMFAADSTEAGRLARLNDSLKTISGARMSGYQVTTVRTSARSDARLAPLSRCECSPCCCCSALPPCMSPFICLRWLMPTCGGICARACGFCRIMRCRTAEYSRSTRRCPGSPAVGDMMYCLRRHIKLIGLRAVPLTLMALKVALAVSAFLLARGSRQNFWLAVSLAIAAQCALLDLRPLPNLCSLVLFAIELALLFQSRRTGNARSLFWLPLLFVFWANLHLQFVYGLFVLGLFFAAALTRGDLPPFRPNLVWHDAPALPLGTIGAVAARLLVVATLLSPYSYHIYEAVVKNASPAAYIAEHHAMNFRHPQHYVLLLLAMAAFLALGRRRSRDLFKITLMIASAVVCVSYARRCRVSCSGRRRRDWRCILNREA